MLSQTELSSLILNSWGNDPPKIGNFQAKALLTWTLWHTGLIFLGWIIYTSKHNCACNLTRWGWGEEEKRNGAWADVYMECLWSLILTKPSPVSGGNGLYIQFPFCTPPCFFFQKWLFPRISVQLLVDLFAWGAENRQSAFSPQGMKMWLCSYCGMGLSSVPTSWWTVLNPASTFWGSTSSRPARYQVVLQQKQ